jgi:archaellum component FlaC
MSEDITKELPMSDSEKLTQLLAISRNVIAGLNQLDARLTTVENELSSLKAGTNPFWQVMHDQQAQILATVQDHTDRIEQMETHLKQQDEKIAALDEKVTVGFRKLGDKFEHIVMDYYELHSDVRDLKRRVTTLEPVN